MRNKRFQHTLISINDKRNAAPFLPLETDSYTVRASIEAFDPSDVIVHLSISELLSKSDGGIDG